MPRFFFTATNRARGTRIAKFSRTPMNAPSWNSSTSPRKEHGKKMRQPSVNEILKEAYQRHGRDRATARAVKHCLG